MTVIPVAESRFRLAFNRDESPKRAVGLPPRVKQFGERMAVLPTDPASGGTWLGVNDTGLVLALLNVNLPDRDRSAPKPRRSRGEIIPALLGTDSPSVALLVAERNLDYRDFAPFRLVLVGNGIVADVRWDGHEPMVMSRLLGGSPQMFTSSGLGDHLVEAVRRELFDDLFSGAPDNWETAQDAFHRHRWPGREHLSVNMTRATARTVSLSTVLLQSNEAVFTYHPGWPDEPAESVILHLPLAAAGAA